MNVLYLSHHFQTPDEPGAPRPWKVSEFLRDRGHSVTVITAGVQYMTGERPDESGWLWSKEDVEGVTVIRTYALTNYRKSFLRRGLSYLLYSFLAFLAGFRTEKPDIVLTGSGIPPSLTMTGYVLARLRGAKFVVEERDLYPEVAVELGHVNSGVLIWLWDRYRLFLRRRAELIVALTPGIKRILVDKGVPEEKIVLVTNAYDMENDAYRENGDGGIVPEEFKEDFVVLYTGGFGQVNELSTLLEAALELREHDDIKFVLIGEGEKKEEYQEFCNENDLSNCYILPSKPKREIALYYDVADVCVQLTPEGRLWECVLSNKVFDYLGSGCPMVYAGRGDTAELLREADAGVVAEPKNPDDVADAIMYLYEHPRERRQMGANAREFILENYVREDVLEELEDALLEIRGSENIR